MGYTPDCFIINSTKFVVASAKGSPEGCIDHTALPDIDPALSLAEAISSYQTQISSLACSLLALTDLSQTIFITSDLRAAILTIRQQARESAIQ